MDSQRPWYEKGLRFECERCRQCCTGAPGFVWVTDEEAEAIAEELGITKKDFYVQYTRRAGFKRSLKEVGPRYDCVFLGETGCSVYNVRPSQCRSWPFWKMNIKDPESWSRTTRICPGAGNGKIHDAKEIKERADQSP